MAYDEGILTDSQMLRSAYGSYGTGVTVVTTVPADGSPVGLTVNSFSSVSLDPPLVLWCLDKSANSLQIFEQTSHFAINVLAHDQVDLSNTFASSGEDKFSGLDYTTGAGDAPLLEGSVAQFECESWATYDGGDHIILVGKIVAYRRNNAPGLLYIGGQYARSTPA